MCADEMPNAESQSTVFTLSTAFTFNVTLLVQGNTYAEAHQKLLEFLRGNEGEYSAFLDFWMSRETTPVEDCGAFIGYDRGTEHLHGRDWYEHFYRKLQDIWRPEISLKVRYTGQYPAD